MIVNRLEDRDDVLLRGEIFIKDDTKELDRCDEIVESDNQQRRLL